MSLNPPTCKVLSFPQITSTKTISEADISFGWFLRKMKVSVWASVAPTESEHGILYPTPTWYMTDELMSSIRVSRFRGRAHLLWLVRVQMWGQSARARIPWSFTFCLSVLMWASCQDRNRPAAILSREDSKKNRIHGHWWRTDKDKFEELIEMAKHEP